MDVPPALRRWFLVHFLVDLLIGLPLLFAPAWLLTPLGWPRQGETSAARLVGAALLAIGTQSFLSRNEGVETYATLLNFNILWSVFAVVGLFLSIGQGAPDAAWALMSLFIAFAGIWFHHRVRLRQLVAHHENLQNAPGNDDDGDEPLSPPASVPPHP